METTAKWIFYLCISLTTVKAFPYVQQPQFSSNSNLDDYCSLMAVNTLLTSFKLPVIGQEVIDHARYRVKRDESGSADNVYVRNIMADTLNQLPLSENTLDTLRARLGFANGGGTQQGRLKSEIRNLLEELGPLRERCLQSHEIGIDAYDNVEGSKGFLNHQKTTDNGMELDESTITRDELENSIIKRNNLSLNPSGWRKRRSNRETERERMAHFLNNMRQLLNKRQQQRLNFNPTGW